MVFDPYKTLEVDCRASDEVIKAAYLALMKRKHPDHSKMTKSATNKVAKDLNKAYEILSNPDSRAEYDAERNDLSGTIIGNYRIIEEIAEGGFDD